MNSFLTNQGIMECVEAISALASFILAIIIHEIIKARHDSDLSPLKSSIEGMIVKELPMAVTCYLKNHLLDSEEYENPDGKTPAEISRDELNELLRRILEEVEYLKYVRPHIYNAIKSKDSYLREIIDCSGDEFDEEKLKKEVRSYIVYFNHLLKGKSLVFRTMFELSRANKK